MKSDTPESNQWLKGYDDTSTVLDAHKTMQKLERQRDEWKAAAEQADIRTGRAKRERDQARADADSQAEAVTNLRAMNLKLQLQLTKALEAVSESHHQPKITTQASA